MYLEMPKMLTHIASTLSFGEFELSSGRKSNHYFDLRTFISQPQTLRMIVRQIKPLEKSELVCTR